ncbi:MAG TPA: zinc-dependent metalloprotease [Gemmatimonadales bacterium]|nr:zinc-dependent metalloprotease [Gemmatimonadales bacterium]
MRLVPLFVAGAAMIAARPLVAQQQPIADSTRTLEKRDGYFPLYWDQSKGRLLLEIPSGRIGQDFLYLPSLATGLGDANIGIDRGTIGREQIARFDRVGPKVLLVLQNPQFRAVGDTGALSRSVQESFPLSTLAAFDLLAEEGGRLLLDVTAFTLSDLSDVRGTLRGSDQGAFQLDARRSTVFLPRTKGFPRNTEIETSLTFTSDQPGPSIQSHAPEARAISVRQHLSLVQLPDTGFRPRRFDPRIGLFPVTYYDFAQPFDQDYVRRYAIRHRLIKKNPGVALSEPVQPIVYYLDAAIPEPYRTAFRQGAMWWNTVFEAAGFQNAFRIEAMPPDMDPMDARYNVIQWVHRTDPDYSIGPAFADPRTGEIIKAAVRMESHRSVVDYDWFAGTEPAREGAEEQDPLELDQGFADWIASLDPDVSAVEFAMARRRQHAAHEVGHTLGLAHNFIAAADGRASVMAYPAPLIKLTNGRIDLSDAYRNGPGAYDSLAIRWAYAEFPAGQEDAGLDAIVREGMARGLRFITNPDEASDNSYPEGTTWVNGSDAVDELARVQTVRDTLMSRFDERAIRAGEPMAVLNRRFATVYLHHRFTLGAAIKAVGGMEYRYGVRGDSAPVTRIIPATRQRRALELLLDAIQPRALAIPERVLADLAPTPFGYDTDPRGFHARGAPAFNQLAAGRTLATMVVRGLLAPNRTARVIAFADRDRSLPTLSDVIDRMISRTWGTAPTPAYAALQRVTQRVVVDGLLSLARDTDAVVQARADAEAGLRRIARLAATPLVTADAEARAHRALAAADIERFLSRREASSGGTPATPPPPGTPIGASEVPRPRR